MADVFFKPDAQQLLNKKHIVFFGDSNARAIYKDLVWLLNYNQLIDQSALKRKQEPTFCGDRLDKHSKLSRGREYEEERSYTRDGVRVDYYFITKCYTPMLVDMMEDIHLGSREAPDIIYINSTLWDVSRWGPNGVVEFKDNMLKLARLFKSSLPTSTLVIWATALPISSKVQSSLLIKQIDFLQHTLRFDVMEANQFARQVMVNHGFDVLDNHFHMRMQAHRRVHDGVHYFPTAIRLLTNLLLTHIALSWDHPLPDRVKTILLDKTKALCGGKCKSPSPPTTRTKTTDSDNKPPPLSPNSLAKVDNRFINRPKKYKHKRRQSTTIKSKNPGRQTIYERYFYNPSQEEKPLHLKDRFTQLRRLKGHDRRNTNWRQDDQQHQQQQQQRWRAETQPPPPTTNPWSPWMSNPCPSTSGADTTNWSEDHWQGSGQMFDTDYDQHRDTSILARASSMLARNMWQQQRYQHY